ncbi:MAG: TIGR03936 family radical SAM-associated protein [Candidatus Omnitrophota bacterium]
MNNTYRIKIEFAKQSWIKFISHLDLLRLFERALRRGSIPFKLSEGFSPHPLIFFKRALKLGNESESEYVTIVLSAPMPLDDFKQRFEAGLPRGIALKTIEEVPSTAKNHGL